MPNTLVHIAVQWPASRRIWGRRELAWAAAGVVIPDLPWMAERFLRLLLDPSRYVSLKVSAVILSSPLPSLMLAAAVALCAATPWRAWLIMGANIVLHALLDGLELKGGNGIFWGAPFVWREFDVEWLHPEGLLMWSLTVAGALAGFWCFARPVPEALYRPRRSRLPAMALLVLVYAALPLAFSRRAISADVFGADTLMGERVGRAAQFDRATYDPEGTGSLMIFSGERLRVEGLRLERRARVTVYGVFVDRDRIRVTRFYMHTPGFRDGASVLGLAFCAAAMLRPLTVFMPRRKQTRTRD